MQWLKLSALIITITVILTACNLGASQVEQPSVVLDQATIVVAQPTDEPTDQPSVTPIPTQQAVDNSVDPVPVVNCTPRTDWGTYIVVGGDTLSRIAVRGNTTLNTLTSGNCLADPNRITPGQVLRVPFPVAPPSPVVVTSTPMPTPVSNACRITTTDNRAVFVDQTYVGGIFAGQAGQTYVITGHNTWNYRIQVNATQEGWLQKSIPETPVGDCGNIFEVGLSYNTPLGARTDICYFIPSIANFQTYVDQAQSVLAFTANGSHQYMVDARAGNQVRLVSGPSFDIPAWTPTSNGRLEGNCDNLPDMAVNTTLNGARDTFTFTGHNVSFEYPANWTFIPNFGGLAGYAGGTQPRFNGYPMAMGLPNDVVIVYITHISFGSFETPRDYAQHIVDDIRANPSRIGVLTDPQDMTLASGLDVVHISLTMPQGPLNQYIFTVDDKIYDLGVQGNQTYAQSIIDSVRSTSN